MAETTLQEKLRANKARSISQADATATREKTTKDTTTAKTTKTKRRRQCSISEISKRPSRI